MAYVTNGLQIYFDAKDYNSSSISTTWTDKSGNGNNGTLTNFSFNGSTSGWNGNELILDGSDDYVSIANANVFDYKANDFTVEVYVRTIDSVNTQPIMLKSDNTSSSSSTSFWIQKRPTNIISCGIAFPASWCELPSKSPITNNVYHHIVFKRQGAYLYLIIDNVGSSSVAIGTSAISSCTSPVELGSALVQNQYSNISIKTVRMYNRALTDAEVTQNYNDVINPSTITTNNLTVSVASITLMNSSLIIGRNLNSSINSLSGNQVTLSVSKNLNGNITNTVSVLTNLDCTKLLSGTTVSNISTISNLSQIQFFNGAINSITNNTANLNLISNLGLIGSLTSNTSTIANLMQTQPLNGNIKSKVTTQGTLSQIYGLSGSVSVLTNIVYNLGNIPNVLLSGTITANSLVNANLSKTINLIGNVNNNIVVLTSNLSTISMFILNGNINAVSNLQGLLTVVKELKGTINTITSVQMFLNAKYKEIYLDVEFTLSQNLSVDFILKQDLSSEFNKNYNINLEVV